jgi:hypothetical protein
MFGFSKKRKPKKALDEFIFAVYGNPPPAERANVEQAISLAGELLMAVVKQQGLRKQGLISPTDRFLIPPTISRSPLL